MLALSTKHFVEVKHCGLDGEISDFVGGNLKPRAYFLTVSVPLTGMPQTVPL